MTLRHLATLEDMLAHSEEFSDTFEYFMEHFGNNPDIMGVSSKTDVPFIKPILGEMGKYFFRKPMVVIADLHIFKVPHLKLLHGMARVENRQVVFFVSRRLVKGLVVMFAPSPTANVEYFRFTPQVLSGDSRSIEHVFDDIFEGREN
jgi:hypothetical protein